ncbi:MAG: hypothetical protein AAGA56_14440 [Myxococcota bacterium]
MRLISPRELLERHRHPRTRADELRRLRARCDAQPSRWSLTPERRRRAEALLEEKNALAEALERGLAEGEIPCASCARGHPRPEGRWPGGHCCGGNTLSIFSAEEVAALKWAGVPITRLRPPRSDHAGCAFRGPAGCSLPPRQRPVICLRYLCQELRQHLRARRSSWEEIGDLSRGLERAFSRLHRDESGDPPNGS